MSSKSEIDSVCSKFSIVELCFSFQYILTAISCPPVTEPINGYVEYDKLPDGEGNFVYSTTATFTCAPEFGILGFQISTCEEDESQSGSFGTFSPAPPTCEGLLYSSSP